MFSPKTTRYSIVSLKKRNPSTRQKPIFGSCEPFTSIDIDCPNVTYDYRALDTTDDMFSELADITGRLISRKQRIERLRREEAARQAEEEQRQREHRLQMYNTEVVKTNALVNAANDYEIPRHLQSRNISFGVNMIAFVLI